MKNADQPAFPMDMETNKHHTETGVVPFGSGLTKREYFAGLAMQGLTAQLHRYDGAESGDGISMMVLDAVDIADNILTQLEA